jgi:hypothetical protein
MKDALLEVADFHQGTPAPLAKNTESRPEAIEAWLTASGIDPHWAVASSLLIHLQQREGVLPSHPLLLSLLREQLPKSFRTRDMRQQEKRRFGQIRLSSKLQTASTESTENFSGSFPSTPPPAKSIQFFQRNKLWATVSKIGASSSLCILLNCGLRDNFLIRSFAEETQLSWLQLALDVVPLSQLPLVPSHFQPDPVILFPCVTAGFALDVSVNNNVDSATSAASHLSIESAKSEDEDPALRLYLTSLSASALPGRHHVLEENSMSEAEGESASVKECDTIDDMFSVDDVHCLLLGHQILVRLQVGP